MTNPVIWLGLSILLLAVGLVALVCVSIPALIGLARAARSAEKFFDTLDRELPRTLEAMRHTGADLRGLADDMTDGVSSARNIVKQVDRSLNDVRQQAYQAKRTTRSITVGFRAAWRVLTKPSGSRKRKRRPPPQKTSQPVDTAYSSPQSQPASEGDSTSDPSNSVEERSGSQ